MRFDTAMDDLIQVRVARGEKRALVETARRRGMTLAEFVREAATAAARGLAA